MEDPLGVGRRDILCQDILAEVKYEGCAVKMP